MNLTIERDILAIALSRVTPLIGRSTIPIPACVKISATAGTLTVLANNMGTAASQTASALISEPGEVCVDAAKFAALVNSLPKGSQLALETNERKFIVRYGKAGRASFNTDDPAAYPVMKSPGEAEPFTIDAGELRRLLAMTLPHVSEPGTRPYLEGVFLRGDETTMVAVATDGNSLCFGVSPVAAAFPGIIVPRDACVALGRILGSASGDVSLAISEGSLRAEIGTCSFQTRLVDGTFPDYRRVTPSPVEHPIEIEAGLLVEIAQRCQAVTEAADATKARPRSMRFRADGAVLRIDAGSEADQLVQEEIEIMAIPEPREIILATAYVLDGVASLGGDGLMEMHITGALNPMLLRRAGNVAESVTIMSRRA